MRYIFSSFYKKYNFRPTHFRNPAGIWDERYACANTLIHKVQLSEKTRVDGGRTPGPEKTPSPCCGVYSISPRGSDFIHGKQTLFKRLGSKPTCCCYILNSKSNHHNIIECFSNCVCCRIKAS